MQQFAAKLAKFAADALSEELITYPKPGLVSHIDNGSHSDMNYQLFINSINSLSGYFYEIAIAAYNDMGFTVLEQLGINAEQTMLAATKNINTHRGSIFILGLLIAAITHSLKYQLPYVQLQDTIISLFAMPLSKHQINSQSHGSIIREKYQLESIIESAQKGFPLLFAGLSRLQEYRLHHGRESKARLVLFFYIMQHLDDTNLIYRGGIEGLQFARKHAQNILMMKHWDDIYNNALDLHKQFIQLNLSPGGCADMLAAVLFIDKVKQLWV